MEVVADRHSVSVLSVNSKGLSYENYLKGGRKSSFFCQYAILLCERLKIKVKAGVFVSNC